MNHKFRFIQLLIVFSLYFVLVSCSVPDPIKIGFVTDLTGRNSQIGLSARNMTEFLINRANKAGGINGRLIELHIADGSDSVTATKVAIEGLQSQGCRYIIGPFISAVAAACVQFASDDILFLSPTISTSRMTGLDDNFIRFIPAVDAQSMHLSAVIGKLGLQNVAAVYDNSNVSYALEVVDGIQERVGPILKHRFAFGTPGKDNLLEVSEKINLDSDIDGIVLASSGLDSATLIQYVSQKKQDVVFLTSMWSFTNDFLQFGGKAIEGAYLVAEFSDHESEEFTAILKLFSEQYSEETTFIHEYTFDTISALLDAVGSVDELNPDSIKSYILEKSSFDFGHELFSIDNFGDCNRNTGMVQVRDGVFVKVDIR